MRIRRYDFNFKIEIVNMVTIMDKHLSIISTITKFDNASIALVCKMCNMYGIGCKFNGDTVKLWVIDGDYIKYDIYVRGRQLQFAKRVDYKCLGQLLRRLSLAIIPYNLSSWPAENIIVYVNQCNSTVVGKIVTAVSTCKIYGEFCNRTANSVCIKLTTSSCTSRIGVEIPMIINCGTGGKYTIPVIWPRTREKTAAVVVGGVATRWFDPRII